MERCTPPAVRWRKMRFQHLVHREPLTFGGVDDALGDELAESRFISMLQLAAATVGEVAARRGDVMWAALQFSIVEQYITGRRASDMATIRRDAIALGGDAFDKSCFRHKKCANARLTHDASSLAVNAGPTSAADRA